MSRAPGERTRKLGRSALVLAALLGGACAGGASFPTRSGPPPSEALPGPPPEVVASAKPATVEVPRHARVALTAPDVLATLRRDGFSLGRLVDRSDAETTEQLARSSLAPVLQDLADAVGAVPREHPTARVSSISGTRLFEAAWLRSPEMHFELTGVMNRLDRRPFDEGSCGEVRFLYRLAYTTEQAGKPMHGRLPLTLNVVFRVPGEGGCEEVAQAWRAPSALDEAGAAAWLASEGALSPRWRARWALAAVEANLQMVRVQSTAHPSMGGHAEYALRVFRPTPGGGRTYEPAPMENLPDVGRLAADPALRRELVTFLRDPAVLRDIDAGVVRLPAKFVATTARSVSPRGLDRPMNRPFREVLKDEDLTGLDLGAYRTIRSAKALVRRLDGLSCTGCHQSRSIAGFHHVGDDAANAPAWSSMMSGSSTHLLADLDRRRAYVEAVAARATPAEDRPSAERQTLGDEGGFGAPCGLGEPGFAAWTCSEGLRCERMEDPDVGVCLDDAKVGAPCETGERIFHGRTPVGDRVAALSRHSCGDDLGCSPNINGFARGACAGPCDAKDASGACIDFVDIDGLQACLRVGFDEAACAERYVVERVDRACDLTHPCRDDFVCARTADPARGACIPPYFVYPLRLDGYPLRR